MESLLKLYSLSGLQWIIVILFSVVYSDSTHLLLRVHLVNKYCNAKFPKLYFDEETSSSISGMA